MQTLQQAYQRAVELSNECHDLEDFRGAELFHNVAVAIDLATKRPRVRLHERIEDLEPCGA